MSGIHDYSTPKGEFHEVRLPNGKVSFEIKWNPGFGPKMENKFNTVQEFVDSECLRLCEDKVPKRENILIESGHLNTVFGSGQIKYRTPYARRWYYMPANFNQGSGNGKSTVGRGNYWFYRMVAEYKNQILSGAQKRVNGG